MGPPSLELRGFLAGPGEKPLSPLSGFLISSGLLRSRALSLLPPALTGSSSLPIYLLRHEALSKLVGFDFHRGIIACATRPTGPSREIADSDSGALTLALAGIENPENLGAILRSAAAFGVDEVWLGRGTVDPWSRRVVRVSMGAIFSLCIRDRCDLKVDLAAAAERGVSSVAMVAGEAPSLFEFIPADRQIVVLGREDQGIEPAILASCSTRATIPTSSAVDSLNVAAAAAVALYRIRAAR